MRFFSVFKKTSSASFSSNSAVSMRSSSFALELRRNSSKILPWLPIVLVIALVLVPLCLFLWLVFFTDIFVIQAVSVLDARPHTILSAKDIIQKRIDQSPLRRNIFFIQTDIIEADLITALPQIRTVHAARKLPGTIKVIIQEKAPSLLLLSNTHYYFVDEQGIAYEEARLETLPGIILPVVKNSDRDSEVTLGVPVVDPAFVQFVLYLQREVPNIVDAKVGEVRIPSLSAREVHFLLDNNWELRFDVAREPQAQLETLRQLLTSSISEDDKKKLEYIDLRIQDRVYYKTRDSG